MEPSIDTGVPRLGHYLPCSAQSIKFALDQQASIPNQALHKRLGELLLEHRQISPQELQNGLKAQRAERLRCCSLFADFPPEALARSSDAFEEQTIEDGEVLLSQGSDETDLYVLATGELEIYLIDDDSGTETPLTTVRASESVGVLGYLFGGQCVASVRAVGRCQLLYTSYNDLRPLLDAPRLAHIFLAAASQQLCHMNLFYLNLYQEQYQHLVNVERSLQHISNFLDLSEITAVGAGIDGLIERLVHTVSNLTDADRASLFLLDPASGDLWSKVAQGLKVEEIRVQAGQGVVGWVARYKELVNIPDAEADDRFQSVVDRRTGYRTRSILCAPIWSLNNELLGVMQVLNKRNGPFNAHDETMLRAFTYQAAVAVENFNLYDKISTVVSSRKSLKSLTHH